MSHPRRTPQYASIGVPLPAEPFDQAAARALIDQLAARRSRPGELKVRRAHPHVVEAKRVEPAGENRSHAGRLGYAIAASLTLLALAGTPALHLWGQRPAAVVSTPALPAGSARPAVAALSERDAAPAPSVQLASLTPPKTLTPRAGKPFAAGRGAPGPEASDEVGAAPPPVPTVEAAATLPADPAPPPAEIRMAALESPGSAAGQPLMLVKTQSASALLGRAGPESRTGGGLGPIQSGNPQRMASGITGASGR